MLMDSKEYKVVVLSRYFHENTYLVAGVCSKCYTESDAKIVSVSTEFLNQFSETPKNLRRKKYFNLHIGDFYLDEPGFIDAPVFELYKEQRQCNIRKHETLNQICSNLEIYEKVPDIHKNTPSLMTYNRLWKPPESPHSLIEEALYNNPWSLLVATIFLNKTSCMYARPVIKTFLEDYSNPFTVLKCKPEDLEKYFLKIGLKKRAHQIWKMSYDFVYKNWKRVEELHGIGKYGSDAFNMFCLGNFEVEPKDRFLRIYKAWFKMTQMKNENDCRNCSTRSMNCDDELAVGDDY